MSAKALLDMIRQCAADARGKEAGDVDARAHAFIAMLSRSLEQYDAIGAEVVFSLLQPAAGGTQ